MNAQLETILRRYLVLVPQGHDVPLETELPALGPATHECSYSPSRIGGDVRHLRSPDSLLNAATFHSAKSLENVMQMLQKERDGHGTGHLRNSWEAQIHASRRLEMRVTDARLIRHLRDSCQLEAWVTLESMQSDPFSCCGIVSHWDYVTAVSGSE